MGSINNPNNHIRQLTRARSQTGRIYAIDSGFLDVRLDGSSTVIRDVQFTGDMSNIRLGHRVRLTWMHGRPVAVERIDGTKRDEMLEHDIQSIALEGSLPSELAPEDHSHDGIQVIYGDGTFKTYPIESKLNDFMAGNVVIKLPAGEFTLPDVSDNATIIGSGVGITFLNRPNLSVTMGNGARIANATLNFYMQSGDVSVHALDFESSDTPARIENCYIRAEHEDDDMMGLYVDGASLVEVYMTNIDVIASSGIANIAKTFDTAQVDFYQSIFSAADTYFIKDGGATYYPRVYSSAFETLSDVGDVRAGSVYLQPDVDTVSQIIRMVSGYTSNPWEIRDDSDDTLSYFDTGGRLVLPQEDVPATPTLAFGDGDTGFQERSDDNLDVIISGANKWIFALGWFLAYNTAGAALKDAGASGTNPTMLPSRQDTNTGIGWVSADILALIAGGVQAAKLDSSGIHTPRIYDISDNDTYIDLGANRFDVYTDGSRKIKVNATGVTITTELNAEEDLVVSKEELTDTGTMSDDVVALYCNKATAMTATLCAHKDGKLIRVFNKGAGTATLSPTSGNIRGSATLDLAQYEEVWLQSDGTDWF